MPAIFYPSRPSIPQPDQFSGVALGQFIPIQAAPGGPAKWYGVRPLNNIWVRQGAGSSPVIVGPCRWYGLRPLNNVWVRHGTSTVTVFVPIALDPWHTTTTSDPNPGITLNPQGTTAYSDPGAVTLNPWGTTEAP